ncbi:MAG: ZIP family metal transporter [Pseudomonadota bacterium]
MLLLYGAGLAFASYGGGYLALRIEMTHTRTQIALSLVSGLMLGIAFFHLFPHAVLTLGVEHGLNTTMIWVAAGLVVMLLLLRLLHFHHPDYYAEGDDAHHHDHAHGEHCTPVAAPKVSWQSVLIGLSFHSLIDGVALGSAFLGSSRGESLLAFGVFVAIALHKPLDSMSIAALMRAADLSPSLQRNVNMGFALLCPMAALLFYAFANGVSSGQSDVVGAALAFSAGTFICIALSDLLPEVQFHSHDRVKLTLVFLAGLAISYAIATGSPEHSHHISEAHEHHQPHSHESGH